MDPITIITGIATSLVATIMFELSRRLYTRRLLKKGRVSRHVSKSDAHFKKIHFCFEGLQKNHIS